MDDHAKFCPSCGRPQQEQPPREKNGRTWHFYVGIFCVVGAIVMLGTDIYASAGYATIAFLLLWKSHRLTKASNNYNYGRSRRIGLNTYTIKQTKLPRPDAPHTPGPGPIYAHVKTNADAILLQDSTYRYAYKKADTPVSDPIPDPGSVPNHKTTPKPKTKSFTARVAGVQYYIDALMELATKNPDYDMSKREIIDNFMVDERIYEYEFCGFMTELVPEPDNPYDKNAVKVVIDGNHIGYIKAGSCARIHKLLREDRIHRINAEIGGGKYKIVYEDEYEDEYALERGKTNYFVHLTIHEKLPLGT